MQRFEDGTKYSEPGASELLCPKNLKSDGSIELNEYAFGRKNRYGGIGPNNTTKLGLPSNVTSAKTLSETLPDQYQRGGILPSPYDKVDQQRMLGPDYIHGFGKNRRSKSDENRDIETLTKLKKIRKHSKKLIKSVKRKMYNRFSNATPGTDSWKDSVSKQSFVGQDQVSEQVGLNAMGNFNTGMLYYQAGPNFDQRYALRPFDINVPMQYTNNQMNTPIVPLSSVPSKASFSFGSKAGTDQYIGPNIVGYEPNIPMYHAGGSTINFLTNQLYKPIGIVGGPTNSTGDYASMGTTPIGIMTVQPNYITPNAYMNTAAGFAQDARINNANGLLAAGLQPSIPASSFGHKNKKRNFSKEIMYTDSPMYQNKPMYMKNKDINDTSGNIASFGHKKSAKKLGINIPSVLKTKIHGNTVTLTRSGKVIVS